MLFSKPSLHKPKLSSSIKYSLKSTHKLNYTLNSKRRFTTDNEENHPKKSDSELLFENIFGTSKGQSFDSEDVEFQGEEQPIDDTLDTEISEEERDQLEKEAQERTQKLFAQIFGNSPLSAKAFLDSGDEADEKSLIPLLRRKVPLSELKYLEYYPKTIRKWVVDAKTPKGYYDWLGIWRAGPPPEWDEEDETHQRFVLPAMRIKLVGRGATKTFRKMFAPKPRERLEPDLIDQYRFGLTAKEVDDLPDKLKNVLSFRLAPDREIQEFRLKRECAKWQKFEGDTGSAAVQIVRLTFYINSLIGHTEKFHHDQPAKRSLRIFTKRRERLMKYLKYKDVRTYYNIVKEYLLEDVTGPVRTCVISK